MSECDTCNGVGYITTERGDEENCPCCVGVAFQARIQQLTAERDAALAEGERLRKQIEDARPKRRIYEKHEGYHGTTDLDIHVQYKGSNQ